MLAEQEKIKLLELQKDLNKKTIIKEDQLLHLVRKTPEKVKISDSEIEKYFESIKKQDQEKILILPELQKYFKFYEKKELKLDQENIKVIEYMLEYFNHQDQQEKGIFIYGTVGTGKTITMKMFSVLTNFYNMKNKFNIISSLQITQNYAALGDKYLNEYIEQTADKNLLIDDVGTEENIVANYGNKKDVVKEFLYQRYYCFQAHKRVTHITTNLPPGVFGDSFGDRLKDRFYEMFTIVKLTGESKRRVKNGN